MVRYWTDDKANGGSETAHIKMMNAKIDTVRETLNLKVEDALWADTGGASVDDYNGIPYLIDDLLLTLLVRRKTYCSFGM